MAAARHRHGRCLPAIGEGRDLTISSRPLDRERLAIRVGAIFFLPCPVVAAQTVRVVEGSPATMFDPRRSVRHLQAALRESVRPGGAILLSLSATLGILWMLESYLESTFEAKPAVAVTRACLTGPRMNPVGAEHGARSATVTPMEATCTGAARHDPR